MLSTERRTSIYPQYVIVTPAFNEAAYIGRTIESVLAQTVKPHLWVIVDDGSADATAGIIKGYAARYPWIQYRRRTKDPAHGYFGSNVYAIGEGVKQVGNQAYDYLAILDADISLPEDYYEQMLSRMDRDQKLGIASGVYENLIKGRLEPVLNDRRSTPKALMVFRKRCFEEIGGFLPLKHGGEDTIACFMARQKGWKVWSFPDIRVVHHRPTGMGHARSLLTTRFKQGVCEYHLAMHPLFFICKALRRSFREKPYLVGGVARMAGYLWSAVLRPGKIIPSDVVRYIRKDQMSRILHGNKVLGGQDPSF